MISIDMSQIPPEKLDHTNLRSLKNQMQSALSQKLWITAFCVHEAGHMIYLRQLGVTEFEFNGPRIAYNKENDTFDGYMASVRPKTAASPNGRDIQEFLRTAAKAHVAGRTFTKTLTNAPDAGEQQDRQNFDALCSQIEKSLPTGATIDRQKSWEQAETEVSTDLRSPQFRTLAWEAAREIERKVFGS